MLGLGSVGFLRSGCSFFLWKRSPVDFIETLDSEFGCLCTVFSVKTERGVGILHFVFFFSHFLFLSILVVIFWLLKVCLCYRNRVISFLAYASYVTLRTEGSRIPKQYLFCWIPRSGPFLAFFTQNLLDEWDNASFCMLPGEEIGSGWMFSCFPNVWSG